MSPPITPRVFGPERSVDVGHKLMSSGYPDFYPSRPGYNQPEDVLTEENVKNGFTAKTFVAPTVRSLNALQKCSRVDQLIMEQAESFSMHGPIHQHLLNGGLERLNKLGEDLLAKRESMMPTIGFVIVGQTGR